MREQLDKAIQEKQQRSVETLQTGAALSQVELQLQALMAEKDVSCHTDGTLLCIVPCMGSVAFFAVQWTIEG